MTHRYIKIGATAFVLVLAFAGLLWSTLQEGAEYYKNLDEVMVNQQEWHGKQLQLHGYIVPGSITSSRCRTILRVPARRPTIASSKCRTPASCRTPSRTKPRSC